MAQSTILYASLSTPANAAFSTSTTGGTLAAGTYYYRVSALDGNGGETLASAETSQVTTGSTSTVTVNWGAVTGATGYKVYGRSTGAELLIAEVGSVTTYIDDGSVTPSGALPTANTTGTTAATSSDVVVAAGATVTVGIFVSSGGFAVSGPIGEVWADTPGADVPVSTLSADRPITVISGPGTFRVKRLATSQAIGVYTET